MLQFKLRIDESLYQRAKELAASQERSLNWWINNLIRQAVLDDTSKPKEQS
jgi:predicted HicB family RNase H-like nuclease